MKKLVARFMPVLAALAIVTPAASSLSSQAAFDAPALSAQALRQPVDEAPLDLAPSHVQQTRAFISQAESPHAPDLLAGNPVTITDGYILTDTVWGPGGSPAGSLYVLEDNLTVAEGVSLTLQPGVELRFGTSLALAVQSNARLWAQGTASSPITFTSSVSTPQAGDWNGVEIQLAGAAHLEYAHLLYAGGGDRPALSVFASDVQVRYSRLAHNAADGVGLDGEGLAPILEDLVISHNGGAGVRQTAGMSPIYRELQLSGNGTDAIVITPVTIQGGIHWDFARAGAPVYVVDGAIGVPGGSFLSLAPGTALHFNERASLAVVGNLYAIGTPAMPITLTAIAGQPGMWGGLHIIGVPGYITPTAFLQNCDLSYAGFESTPVLEVASDAIVVQNCAIHGGAADGIEVLVDTQPVLRYNQVYSNAQVYTDTYGLRNSGQITVDARYNWWGDASGPRHATNPAGRGDEVSDLVQFDPWLPSPATASPPVGQLVVEIAAPRRASPGELASYGIYYANLLTRTLENAVLRASLPMATEYVDSTGGGLYWPQRHQVFWKLGNLAPGSSGTLWVQVRYQWGLANGTKHTIYARLASTSAGFNSFDVAPYLVYQPTLRTDKIALSAAELAAERAGFADLDLIYSQAISGGFQLVDASRLSFSRGELITQVVLLHADPPSVMYLRRQGSRVLASIFEREQYAIRGATGGITRELQLGSWEYWGSWAAAQGQVSAQASVKDCFFNCVLDQIPDWIASNLFKSVGAIATTGACIKCVVLGECLSCGAALADLAPGLGEAVDIYGCAQTCEEDPSSYDCEEDKVECSNGGFYGLLGIESKVTYECQDDGTYSWPQYVPCSGGSCEDGECTYCSPFLRAASVNPCAARSGAGASCQITGIEPAHDPNAKYGPAGDVTPGQQLTYTITYENEGAGQAFEVYILDTLDAAFDANTVAVYGGGQFVTATRKILWLIGTLPPKGQPGSAGAVSVTARLRSDLPGGTAVSNQATVYFPSAYEETPTNPVLNIVQPVTALPQRLETEAGRAVAITLRGQDPGGAPLAYQVVSDPLNGSLSGIAPHLVYTPELNFSGLDSLAFTATNGIAASRPALVEIAVAPSSADTTAPRVLWTYPAGGDTSVKLPVTQVFTDAAGPLYSPSLLVQFSEAIDPTTVNTQTLRLSDSRGRILTSVRYDAATRQGIAIPREAWRAMAYTATVSTGVQDASGNPLEAEYAWSFTVLGQAGFKIYLPLVLKEST
ncbi:MAG: Ig-like domain-containing protein [Thermoflexales bacterium]|nr:Ig-like domain-containing protein [Thermoflexales bacterium]